MSLIKKYFLSNFTYKTISVCSYLFRDTRINCTQYYTCFGSSANIQSNIFNYKKLGEQNGRTMSVMAFVKENNFTEKTKNTLSNLQLFFSSNKRLGYLWFQTLDEINVEDFFTLFKMEDSFYSWFKVIQLHVWMILCHLSKENKSDRRIRTAVIEAMWEDSQKRAKILFPKNTNSRKNFRTFHQEFLFSLLYYDLGFHKSDVSLSNAVWVNFFNRQNVDPRLLEGVVSYIRYQMHHLDKIKIGELSNNDNKSGIWAPARPHIESILGKSYFDAAV